MAENSFEAISSQWLNQPVLKLLKYVKVLAIAASLPVIFTMYGWIFNIGVLLSFLPGQMPMKFISAVCFFLSGLSLIFVSEVVRGKREIAQIVLPGTSISVLLLMSTVIAGSYLEVETGVESLFVGVLSRTTNAGVIEMPSIFEVVGFVVVAIIGILSLFRIRYLKPLAFFCGLVMVVLGLLALTGNLTGNSFLVRPIFPNAYPMVFASSLIFLILGLALCLLGWVINKLSNYPYD